MKISPILKNGIELVSEKIIKYTLEKRVDEKIISECTGISIDEIKKLKRNP